MGWFSQWPWVRALAQSAAEVTVRGPGYRFLSAPRPVGPYAADDWEFAWLAATAYGKTPAAAKRRANTADQEEHVDAEARLRESGWEQWKEFPSTELHRKIAATHLRVEVWEKKRTEGRTIVAVTFGGTVFNNDKDWLANLRWFLPGGWRDQYTDVVRLFAPAFIPALVNRLGGRAPQSVELVSIGHSLGGGLAQQFAYAHCLTDQVPRISKVYAFDPSPVTGFFSVRRSVRNVNRRSLRIDRIYERGEILAIVRSMTSVLWKPSAQAPAIRGLRYFLFFAWNPIVGHSMTRMAVRMEAAARPKDSDYLGEAMEQRKRLPVRPSELYLKIFGELKKEIAESVRDARATERNTLLSCGALWAFILGKGHDVQFGLEYLTLVPLALALFGGWRVAALMMSIRPRAKYLRQLEESTVEGKPLVGWEIFFRRNYRLAVGITQYVFWIVLIASMAVLARNAPTILGTLAGKPIH